MRTRKIPSRVQQDALVSTELEDLGFDPRGLQGGKNQLL